MPGIKKEEASILANDIRDIISNYLFDFEEDIEVGKDRKNKIKVSIGVTDSKDMKGDELIDKRNDIIKKADDALFYAKNSGKNKVSVWSEDFPRVRGKIEGAGATTQKQNAQMKYTY